MHKVPINSKGCYRFVCCLGYPATSRTGETDRVSSNLGSKSSGPTSVQAPGTLPIKSTIVQSLARRRLWSSLLVGSRLSKRQCLKWDLQALWRTSLGRSWKIYDIIGSKIAVVPSPDRFPLAVRIKMESSSSGLNSPRVTDLGGKVPQSATPRDDIFKTPSPKGRVNHRATYITREYTDRYHKDLLN